MFPSIVKCLYVEEAYKTRVEFVLGENEAEISAGPNSKKVDIRLIQCLEVFFSNQGCENWTDFEEKEDRLILTTTKATYKVSKTAQNASMFSDLKRFLDKVYDGSIKPLELRFESFDGGGPTFEMQTEDIGIYTWFKKRVYLDPNHEQQCGSGFDEVFTIFPLRPGKTSSTITGTSFITPPEIYHLECEVDEKLEIHSGFRQRPKEIL